MRLVALLILTTLPFRPLQAEEQGLELAVKATYLVKFEPFVSWPAASFADPAAPFVLCVAEPDPFGPLLEKAADGLHAGSHPILIQRIGDAGESAKCKLLYIGRAASAPKPADFRGKPVLTITDAAPEERRGIIDFRIVDGRVRFTIDDAAAAESGLSISSKLLSLAVSVHEKEAN